MKSIKLVIGSAVVAAAVLGASLLGIASAQTSNPTSATDPTTTDTSPHPTRFVAQVASVGASSLSLTATTGSVTANVGGNTWILVEKDGKCAEGALSDVQTGKAVVIAGMTTSQPGVVDARVVSQGAKCNAAAAQAAKDRAGSKLEKLAKHMAAGTIKSIDGSTITITNARGNDVAVTTSESTVVFNNGFSTVSALKVGDEVYVLGRPLKDGADNSDSANTRSIQAIALAVENPNTQFVIGRVESVNGNTVTLRTPKHPKGITVTLDSSTAYKTASISGTGNGPTLADGSQADVQAGSNLVVEGIKSSDGISLTAKAVVVLPAGKGALPDQ